MEKLKELEYIINHSDSIVFFGGAGVSTESGIPDFRSTDGLYNQKYKYPPEIILSHTFFMNETERELQIICLAINLKTIIILRGLQKAAFLLRTS